MKPVTSTLKSCNWCYNEFEENKCPDCGDDDFTLIAKMLEGMQELRYSSWQRDRTPKWESDQLL